MKKSPERVNKREIRGWVESAGGFTKAVALIVQKLECSESKAEKIAAGNYPSRMNPSEQNALSELVKKPRDVLFSVGKPLKKAS